MTPILPTTTGYADPGPRLVIPAAGARRPRVRIEWYRRPVVWSRPRAVEEAGHSAVDRACRILNVSVALVGLIVAAPLMLLIAAAVRLTSPGPAIYTQPRVGLDRRRLLDRRRRSRGPWDGTSRRKDDHGGRIFTIYKFRTMRTDRPRSQVWSSPNDARTTPVGRFLRSTRLDELPQIFNVLKGDMNIVGPRPEQPEIFQELSQSVGNYRQRQQVLPGITGLAQVNMGYDRCLDDVRKKVRFDLAYIRRRSAAADLMIMAKTMPVMVFRRMWM